MAQRESLTLNGIQSAVTPLVDYRNDPYPPKGIWKSIPHFLIENQKRWGALGLLADDVKIRMAIHKHRSIVTDNVRADETARPQLEVDLVQATKNFDLYTYIAASAGDLAHGYQYDPRGAEEHPKMRSLEIALRHIGIALAPAVALLGVEAAIQTMLGGKIDLSSAAIGIGEVVALGGLSYPAVMGVKRLIENIPIIGEMVPEGDLLRRPVEADPLHLRMALGVAFEKGWDDYVAKSKEQSKTREATAKIGTNTGIIGKHLHDLAAGTYVVLNRNRQADRYVNDDASLQKSERGRSEFATLERLLLFAEIASDPALGLMLLAKHKPNDSIFQQTLSKLPAQANHVLKEIMTQSYRQNADPDVSGDPNNKRIIQALDDLEVVQMMELLVNTAATHGDGGIAALFPRGFSNGRGSHRSSESQELRAIAFRNISQKIAIPLIGTILSTHGECPPDFILAKFEKDYIHAMPPVGMADVYMDGNPLPAWIASLNETEASKAYKNEINTAAWNVMRTLLPLIKKGAIPVEVREVFIDNLHNSWQKRDAFKAGFALPKSLMKFFEAIMDQSENGLSFIYHEFTNLIEKNILSQAIKKPEQVVEVVDSMAKSLNKRGNNFSNKMNTDGTKEMKAIELQHIDRLGNAILYSGEQLLDMGKAFAASLPANDMSPIAENTQLWVVRTYGMKQLALSIINNRKDAKADLGGTYDRLVEFVTRVDQTLTESMQQLGNNLYSIQHAKTA